ncbi:non-ribosomal peptide synthetase [Streptomyces sp. Tu 3180]|uniref:non-ribosomal peptide synthetase n=1 Tax=Streptomyces sp. Tu 3180 TaxID=2682611 RepID=UPI00135818EB|nr:non-ribosomal peptide synthetase [Streptomyces sp. Tu 3180]KAF3468931.1 amino acid adenylation domain-containing protein [Streptomyces sp. Tu 3180]
MLDEAARPTDWVPLGAAQRGIWYAQRLDPGNPLHNGAACLDLRGPLDTGALAEAVRHAVAGTEALRLEFAEHGADGDEPVQRLAPAAHVPVTREEATAEEALRWMRDDLAAAAPPHRGPRAAHVLFHAGADRHLWYHRADHLLLDGMGMWLLQRRVEAVHTALAAGRAVPADPAAPLARLWEEEAAYRASRRFEDDRAHWLRALRDRPPALSLAGPPATTSHAFVRSGGTLAAGPARALEELAARFDSARPAAVVAAVAALVHRLTGATDLVLGLAVNARLTPAARRTPAMTANVVPLRLTAGPGTLVGDLVGQAADALRAALRHQRYPQEELRRDLRILGSRQPLYGPVVNIMRSAGGAFATLPARLDFLSNGPVDDLKITCYDSGSGPLPVDLDANPERYPAAELDRHRERFLHLLEEFAADPDRPLARIDLRTPAERRATRPAPAPAPDPAGTLPGLFARQADRHPDRTAVTAEDEHLTYRELDRRADRLARLLLRHGAGPGHLVALALPRSAVLPVALLAVLKTGAGYLPLDPGYPADRLALMIEDARPALLLTVSGEADRVPAGPHRITLDGPACRAALEALADTPLTDADRGGPGRAPHPDHTAYVIYTSGSTGRPKGVVVPHRNVVRLFATARPAVGFGADDVWTLLHSYAFDFSVWEIWGPLLHGGRLVVVPHDTVRTPARLLRLLAAERVTVLSQTPTAFQQLILTEGERPDLGRDLALRRVVLGGEALDPGSLRDWYTRHPEDSPRVVNMYGITETTVHVTHLPMDRRAAGTATTGSPIGQPLADLGLYLLDSALRPAVPGTTGELYVSGAGLARGYLGRPALTAERFVADPYGPPGARMYRTGDLARYTEEHGLAHLGRADGQVQLRGFRIETAEIDAELGRLPSVAACATVLKDGPTTGPRLVSYVVPAAGARIEPAGLRDRLARSLPPHAVPSAVVALPALPLTPNGKLDRDALPDPVARPAGRAPANPVERELCALFQDVLGCGPVGADDDFFDLGGHSLLATRLVARVRAAFGADLGVGTVFDASTPAALATRVRPAPSRPGAGTPPAPAPGEPDGDVPAVPASGRLPLAPAQRRMWALHRMQGPNATYNLPCAFRLTGDPGHRALEEALRDVVRRHGILRTRYPDTDGEPVQEILPPAAADRLALTTRTTTEQELPGDLTGAARLPFDLAADLPLRATLFALPPAPDGSPVRVLLLVLHHIAGDGWSLRPLLSDLGHAYAARRLGRAPHWSRPAPHPAALRPPAGGPAARPDGLEYWRRTLDGAPEQLPLPTDRPRRAVAGHGGASVPLEVDADLHTRLQTLARDHHATLFMVLHAALAALLTASGAGTDVVIGSPTSGRPDATADEVVGFFVNPVALRVDTSGSPSFSELLARVRRTDLAAYDHQDVPFDRVVDALAPQRTLSRHPLFQVVLSFQDTAPRLDLPRVPTATLPVDLGAAKFDLTVNLVERRAADGTAAGLTGDVEYATDLFDAGTARATVRRLLTLLRAVAADPARPVTDVDLTSARERRLALGPWNPPATPAAHPHLPALFAAQAAARPDGPALEADGTVLTYAELDAATDRLARLLLHDGVGAGTVVPIALPRCGRAALAWLAVLKTGACCLPVDPTYPAERVRHLLAAAPGGPVLTAAAHTAVLPRDTRRIVLDEPAVRSALAALPATPLADAERPRPIHPDDPAYVIHTSGSTGSPKGVVVPHTGLPALAAAQVERFALDAGSRVLQLASPSFDASVMETLMAYAAGATLVVPPPGPLAGADLAEVAAARGITHALVPPTALTGVPPESLPGLRTLVVGGEACPPALAARWSTGRRLVNAYGPTETTACATMSLPLDGEAVVPIGTPVAGLRVHVLDERLRLAPTGVPGELYIAGPGVAHGYRGRPGATAERFVADPYGPPGSRAFRTGDLGRRRADGTLEYLGRADDQVKIRGFRVEPGEITAALGRHPAVRRCAVVAREDRPGDRRLVAYVVPGRGHRADPADLRRHLAGSLPAHMVPAAFVTLETLPVTAQGKLDRAALPAPGAEPAPPPRASRPPRPGTEETVCAALAEVLGTTTVGPDDDFFEHGGDSILAIRLVGLLRSRGLGIATKDVFQHRTAAALAAHAATGGDPDDVPGPRRTAPATGPFPAPPMAHWLHDSGGPVDTFSQTMIVRTPPLPDTGPLLRALQHLIDSHDALRTTLLRGPRSAPAAARLRLRPAPQGTPDAADCLRRVPVDAAPDESVRTTELTRARAELAPEQGRMLRAVWFDAGDREGRLALVVHHLAVDAVSWGVLLPALRTACEAALAGTPLPRPPARTPYADWAARLPEEAASPGRVRELPLWTAVLEAPRLRLGARPRDPRRDTFAALRHHTADLPVPVTRDLLTTVPTAFHCRVLEPLVAALGVALLHQAARAGRTAGDVLLDLEGHGRDTTGPGAPPDTAVGWFTCLHPLRLPLADLDPDDALAGGAALGHAVRRVKEAVRALPSDGSGFGLLRRLNDRTAPVLARLDPPPLAFNYLGRFRHDDTPWSAAPDDTALAGGERTRTSRSPTTWRSTP